MNVMDGLLEWPWEAAAVTMGVFDGVHLGHWALLERTVAVAREHGLRPVALTFEPHPDQLLHPGSAPGLLTSTAEKSALIQQAGISSLVLAHFDRPLSEMEPEAFVQRLLVGRLAARYLVVGHRVRFGRGGRGDLDLLRVVAAALGVEVECVGPVLVDGEQPSSTLIRELLQHGDLPRANRLLGRPYRLLGKVEAGRGRGRTLGFPTANLAPPPGRILPAVGIYAALASWGDCVGPAVVNVGCRPTFDAGELCVEAHLLGFSGELRGRQLALSFLHRLRDERRFDSADQLQAQIAQDIADTRHILAALQGRGDVLE